jgi:ribonuclease HI
MKSTLEVYIDGASRGNPGPAGVGILAREANGKDFIRCGKFLGETTSNVAEYTALIEALEMIAHNKKRTSKPNPSEIGLIVKSDSKLLINQITGNYRIKSKNLIPLVIKARKLLNNFHSAEFKLITRPENKIADKLANKSMNLQEDLDELKEKIIAL